MNRVKINIILVGLFLVALSGYASAKDLSDYPDIFVDDENLDVIIVVGDKASASHAIAQAQVALSLTNFIGKKILGLSKLASEVDEIDDVNIVSIGNACDNEITSSILGNPSPCEGGLEEGKATIEFFGSGDSFHIVLNALSDDGIKKISEVLSNYESYNFSGNVFEIDVTEEVDVQAEETKEENDLKEDEEIELKEEIQVVGKIETKQGEEKIEFEETEPEPILDDDDDLIKKIINWLLSLFGIK